MGQPVALVLALDQPLGLHLRVDEVLDQVEQQRGGMGQVVGHRVEQVEIGLLAGKDPQLHAPSHGEEQEETLQAQGYPKRPVM